MTAGEGFAAGVGRQDAGAGRGGRGAFTLVELLVVIAIIGLLVAPAPARRAVGPRIRPPHDVQGESQADRAVPRSRCTWNARAAGDIPTPQWCRARNRRFFGTAEHPAVLPSIAKVLGPYSRGQPRRLPLPVRRCLFRHGPGPPGRGLMPGSRHSGRSVEADAPDEVQDAADQGARGEYPKRRLANKTRQEALTYRGNRGGLLGAAGVLYGFEAFHGTGPGCLHE